MQNVSLTLIAVICSMLCSVAWAGDLNHQFVVGESRFKDGRLEVDVTATYKRKYDRFVVIAWQYRTVRDTKEQPLETIPNEQWGIAMGPIISTSWSRGKVNQGEESLPYENTYKIPFHYNGPRVTLSGEEKYVRMMITSMVTDGPLEDEQHPNAITVFGDWFEIEALRQKSPTHDQQN